MTTSKLICTLCGHEIRDRVYVMVTVPAAGGLRYEPRHLACDTRLRRVVMEQLEPSPADAGFLRRRILYS